MTENDQLLQQMVELYIRSPYEGEALAREFGLWDLLYETILHPLQIQCCREDVNAFIEYAFVDSETGECVDQQDFHKEWQAIMAENGRTMIIAPRGHGKCTIKGTKIALADGGRINVEDLPLGKEFDCISWTPGDAYSIQKARVWQSTIQPCYQITTKSGRTTGYSEEHPCWTGRGWVTVKNLVRGDVLAVARNIPGGKVSYSLDRAWLLGLLIGDGSLTVPGRVGLTCADVLLLEKLPERVGICGFYCKQTRRRNTCYTYNITHGATKWIRKFGLNGKSSHTKFIPPEILTWNNESIASFIGGYFDADGCVSTQSKVAEFSSVNHQLLLDMQSLLLRLGVVSSIRIKNGTYKEQPHKSYRLQINGGSLSTFASIVGSTSSKGAKLQTLVSSLGTSNDNIDLIPESVLERLQVKRGCRSDRQDGCDISNRRPRGCLRRKVQILARKQNQLDLYNEADLFWDEVVSIEYLGGRQTYSVEVDNTHVHITDDFITHNSIQIIGRVIWMLGHNPNLRIKIIAASDDKAKEILGLIRDFIGDSERVREVFPNLQIDSKRGDRTTDFFVKRTIRQRDASVEASGVLSAGAGGRADVLICDDIVDLKNAVTNPAMREQVIKAVQETWFSLVSATGRIIWICTPYHVADATHVLKATGVFKVWMVPAIKYTRHVDDSGDPVIDPETDQQLVTKQILWPDKWSEEKLMDKKAEVGTRVFERQYLLNAMSDEERTFPETALEGSFDLSRADIGDDVDDDWVTFGGVDLASALGKKNAWTVIWTIALNPYDHKLYLKEMYRRRLPFTGVMTAIINQYRKHRWRIVKVENNGFQQAVIDALGEEDGMIPVEPFTTGQNKANEKIGLPGMSVAFEKGHFAIPAARFPLAPDDPSLISVLMNELRTHPGGEFSDTVMALWFAWSAAISGAGDFEKAWLEAQRTA